MLTGHTSCIHSSSPGHCPPLPAQWSFEQARRQPHHMLELLMCVQDRLQRSNKLVKQSSSSNLADMKGGAAGSKSGPASRASSTTRSRAASVPPLGPAPSSRLTPQANGLPRSISEKTSPHPTVPGPLPLPAQVWHAPGPQQQVKMSLHMHPCGLMHIAVTLGLPDKWIVCATGCW